MRAPLRRALRSAPNARAARISIARAARRAVGRWPVRPRASATSIETSRARAPCAPLWRTCRPAPDPAGAAGATFEQELPSDELDTLAPPIHAALFESSVARLAACSQRPAGQSGACGAVGDAIPLGIGAFFSRDFCAALLAPAAASAAASSEEQQPQQPSQPLQPPSETQPAGPSLALDEWLRSLEHRPHGARQLLATATAHAPAAVRANVLNHHLRAQLGTLGSECEGVEPVAGDACAARADAAMRAALGSADAAFVMGIPVEATQGRARDALLNAHRALLPPPPDLPSPPDLSPPPDLPSPPDLPPPPDMAAGVCAAFDERGCAPDASGAHAPPPAPHTPPFEPPALLASLRVGGLDALAHRLRLAPLLELARAGRPRVRARRRRVASLHFTDGSSCACGGACALDASCCAPTFALACDAHGGAQHDGSGALAPVEQPPLPPCAPPTAGLRARASDARARRLALHNDAHFPAVVHAVDEAGAEVEIATIAPAQALALDATAGDALRARSVGGWLLLEVEPAGWGTLTDAEERHRIGACEPA